MPDSNVTLVMNLQLQEQMRSGGSSWGGLSAATIALAMTGNCLMLPRALFTCDGVWLVGTIWAIATGWTMLICLALNHSTQG